MGRYSISPGDGDRRHGTANGYGNLGCRCEGCTAAWAVWHREYMHRKPERLEMHAMRQRQRERGKRRNT